MSFIDLVSSSDEEDVIEIIPLPNYPPNPAAATFPPPFSSQTKDGKDGDGYEDKMSSRLYMEANPHAHASLDDSSSSSASSSSSSLLPVPNKYHPTNTTTAPSPPTGSCSGSGSSLGININTQKLDAYLEAQAAALGGGDSAGSGARVSTNIDPTYEQTVQRMQQESEAKIKQARLWSRQQEEVGELCCAGHLCEMCERM
jgi:hypothetical protein